MLRWNQRTPEFETVVVIISSPLALAVALWGMTTRSTIRIMKNEMVTIATLPNIRRSMTVKQSQRISQDGNMA
jgi:hypothetical protein